MPRHSKTHFWAWPIAVVLVALLTEVSSGADVVVRVVFEFKDDLLKKQYPQADLPQVEKEISEKMAIACKERLRHWRFEASTPAAVIQKPPTMKDPVLSVWVSRTSRYELMMRLDGPKATVPAWSVTLYEPGDIAINGLPDTNQLSLDIFEKFRHRHDAETMLKKHDGPVNKQMQDTVPIALGDRYRFVGPNMPQNEADALALITLDTTQEEYKELRYSKFLIRYTFKAPRAGEAKALATGDGQEPQQPHIGVRLCLSSWAEGAAELMELASLRQNDPVRFRRVLSDLVSLELECQLVYLREFNPQDAIR